MDYINLNQSNNIYTKIDSNSLNRKMVQIYKNISENLYLQCMCNIEVCYIVRDANFYGLPIVTTENCKNFQFATDYGKLKFFYGEFFKK